MNKNKIVLITGSLGLIGFETTLFFLDKGYSVIGIDNNLRAKLFNIETKYSQKLDFLKGKYSKRYRHYDLDIREKDKIEEIFRRNNKRTACIIHTAAQTSHDWAQKDPFLDFTVNALGTLNILESYRKYAPQAVFIFTSTNKVYGDLVNSLPLKESKNRYDLKVKDKYYKGIPETFSIDQSMHSLFGASKVAADVLVQEYGRYFNLNTGVFRLGVVAGGGQSASLYQGFLSYLIEQYTKGNKILVIGYKGKQVRDVIHAKDVANAFYDFFKNPKPSEIFNMGGGRENSVSVKEVLDKLYILGKKKIKLKYIAKARNGDHKWWISDTSKFRELYPKWRINYSIDEIIMDIYKSYDISRKI